MKTYIETRALPPSRPSREAYEAALARRDQLKATVRDWYSQHNILMLAHPVIMGLPPKMSDRSETEVGGQKCRDRAQHRLGVCASMSSLVLPAGETPSGLPVGLEFDALSGQDRELLSVGLSLEATLGRANRPPLLG
nr:amidase family protein [Bradyrhizobium sp. ISRA463]